MKQPVSMDVKPYKYPDLRVKERDVVKSILSRYEYDTKLFCYRNNTGAGKFVYPGGKQSQFIRFGLPGAPDIMGVLKPSGRMVCIECKTAKGKQSPDQMAYQQLMEEYGALYILARDVQDVENAIREALA